MSSKRIRKKRSKPPSGPLRCALCGRKLDDGVGGYVSGFKGLGVCHQCIRASYAMAEAKKPQTAVEIGGGGNMSVCTPQALQAELGRTIAGQEVAKRAVSLALWKQSLKANGNKDVPSSHLLLHGPTGCGKTMLASRAAELSGLPWYVFDTTTITEAGYRGRDAVDILKDYLAFTQGRPKQAYGVIILDEIDKLTAEGSDERQVYYRATQRTLFKMLEGSKVPTGDRMIDTSKLLFVLCGVFPGVVKKTSAAKRSIGFLSEEIKPEVRSIGPEDFINFGMEAELMGRVADIAPIHPLTEKDLVHILTKSEGSAFRQYQAFFKNQGVDLTMPPQVAEEIARRTLALGTGARGLRAELDKILEPLLLLLAEGKLNGRVEVTDGLSELQQAAR